MTHSFANTLYLYFCMLGNCSCHYFRLLTSFKIKFLQIDHQGPPLECQTVWNQIKINILLVFIWVQTVCKRLLADEKIIRCIQRLITGKYLVFNISSHILDIHVCVYHIYSGTLNLFYMLCPLNKANVIFKGSILNETSKPPVNKTHFFN